MALWFWKILGLCFKPDISQIQLTVDGYGTDFIAINIDLRSTFKSQTLCLLSFSCNPHWMRTTQIIILLVCHQHTIVQFANAVLRTGVPLDTRSLLRNLHLGVSKKYSHVVTHTCWQSASYWHGWVWPGLHLQSIVTCAPLDCDSSLISISIWMGYRIDCQFEDSNLIAHIDLLYMYMQMTQMVADLEGGPTIEIRYSRFTAAGAWSELKMRVVKFEFEFEFEDWLSSMTHTEHQISISTHFETGLSSRLDFALQIESNFNFNFKIIFKLRFDRIPEMIRWRRESLFELTLRHQSLRLTATLTNFSAHQIVPADP